MREIISQSDFWMREIIQGDLNIPLMGFADTAVLAGENTDSCSSRTDFTSANLQSEINGIQIWIRNSEARCRRWTSMFPQWRSRYGAYNTHIHGNACLTLPQHSERCKIQELLFEFNLAEVAQPSVSYCDSESLLYENMSFPGCNISPRRQNVGREGTFLGCSVSKLLT